LSACLARRNERGGLIKPGTGEEMQRVPYVLLYAAAIAFLLGIMAQVVR
jgi:hypothetical protein